MFPRKCGGDFCFAKYAIAAIFLLHTIHNHDRIMFAKNRVLISGGICVKKVWKACTFVVLGLAVILCFSVYQKPAPQTEENNSIIGTWQDEYGLKKYTFAPDGKMKIQALSVGSFHGQYNMQNDRITIEYNVLMKKEKSTYQYKLKDHKLYLDDQVFTRKK